MQPILLYYAVLFLCGVVFLEVLIRFKTSPRLKLYFLLIIASLFAMNFFAITGISTKIEFIVARFMRLVYACSTLLVLIHLVNPKIPRWFIALIAFAAFTITGIRIANYNEINLKTLSNVPNHVFTIGADFYVPKTGGRYIGLALAISAIVIGYYYYKRLMMKLNYDNAQHIHVSLWIISLVLPFFLLTIFGILGNLYLVNQSISSFLFAFFSFTTICCLILRPKFLGGQIFKGYSSGSITSVSATRPT